MVTMNIIDLTMPLDNKTPAYRGDPIIKVKQIATIKKDGWNEKRIHINTHCGTHIDAPSHMVSAGRSIDKIPLNAFFGEGVLIDVKKKNINLPCLKGLKCNSESVVLFLTGQSDKRYQKYYNNTKFVSTEVAHQLVKLKVKAIGIDSFSPDQEPYPVHKILLQKGILIIENLINLKSLIGKKFQVQYFPLSITDGDGAPCRVLAFVK